MKYILRIGNKPITIEKNILQLTDAPDLVTTGDGDKYIGYEHIGGAYSGNRKYVIEERNSIVADYMLLRRQRRVRHIQKIITGISA